LGRLVKIAPRDTAATSILYNPPAGEGTSYVPPSVDVVTESSVSGSIRKRYEYDSIGRLVIQKSQLADGTWSGKRTILDTLGRTSKVTEDVALSGIDAAIPLPPAVPATQYENFDAFGRSRLIRTPDGKETTFTFTGARVASRTVDIATTSGGTAPTVDLIEERDGFGRLISVTERGGPTSSTQPVGADVTTTYGYDPAGHLKRISMAGGAEPQIRELTYDGRGLLIGEKHPELGINGNGTVSYPEYDARGHLCRKVVGDRDGKLDVAYVYDTAERLTDVYDLPQNDNAALSKLFIHSEYGSENGTGDFGLGKVRKAVRHNYLDGGPGDVIVTQEYTYGGKDGRVNRVDTSVATSAGPVQTFTQRYEYNDVGDTSKLTYPSIAVSGGAAPVVTDVTHLFRNGFLVGIQGYADRMDPASGSQKGITYWPNGLPREIVHTSRNGAASQVDAITLDSSGMRRPRQITFTGYCVGPALSPPTPATKTVPAGTMVEFTVTEIPGATYQWYKGARGVTTTPVPGQTSYKLHIDHLNESATYWVRVAGADGCPSDSATVSANILVCDASVLNIELQPKSTFTPVGGSVSFSVAVSGAGPLYQWYEGISGDASRPVNGATGTTLNLSSVQVRANYWVRVSNAGGCSIDSATATVEICTPPVITVQPASQAGNVAASVTEKTLTTSVTASGVSLQYAWYEATLDANGQIVVGSQVPNQSGPTFSQTISKTITGSSSTWPAAKSYVVKVTDTGTVTGCRGPTTSNIFSFIVREAAECIRLIASPGEHVATPASPSIVLSVRVEGTGPFHYKWYHGINGQSSPLPNAPDAQDVTTGVFGGYDAYWCVITSEECPGASVTTPKSYAHA